MKRPIALAWLAAPLWAHMISISSGEVRLTGNQLEYSLRMPLYELAHLRDPERALFANLHFRSGGAEARLVEKSCKEDPASDAYDCEARYEFARAPQSLEVECTFHAVTVPNHVHLLRAIKRGPPPKTDQAVFDLSFPRATLRFDPPSGWTTMLGQAAAGMRRAAGGAAQLLFLAALVLAARSRRELLGLAAAFLTGEIAACLAVLHTAWQPAPRFVEAAAALTIAYLAAEVLLLPKAGKRWIVAGVLGAFHGLYFELFLKATGYQPAAVLAGMALIELVLVAVIGWTLARLARLAAALRPVTVSAGLLLAAGIGWFLLRLKS